jgi:hypothetical protein
MRQSPPPLRRGSGEHTAPGEGAAVPAARRAACRPRQPLCGLPVADLGRRGRARRCPAVGSEGNVLPVSPREIDATGLRSGTGRRVRAAALRFRARGTLKGIERMKEGPPDKPPFKVIEGKTRSCGNSPKNKSCRTRDARISKRSENYLRHSISICPIVRRIKTNGQAWRKK